MIGAIGSLLALALAVPTSGQTTQANAFVSPCPNVFMYEPPGTELGKWYGSVNLSTDTTLYALWLNIVLESKADILGNWVGEVTTDDNIDFKIENTKMKISPDQPLTIRFFIQYNAQSEPPKLKAIRFNGKEICNVDLQLLESETPARFDINDGVQIRPDITTTTIRPTTTTLKPQYWTQTKPVNNYQIKTDDRQQTTLKPQYWTETKTEQNQQVKSGDRSTTTLKPQYWQQTKSDNNHQVKTTVKPQYWTQKSQEKTQTTSKPTVWPNVKSDNTQHIKSDSKIQTRPDDRLHATTVNKLQSTSNVWSQTKVENNQQISNQDKNTKPVEKQQTTSESYTKSRPESLSQVVQEITTQSWGQFNVNNKQQTRSDDRYHTKNENKSQTTVNVRPGDKQQISTENQSQTNVEQVIETQYWPKITVEDNLQIKPERQENIQQTRPDDRFQSKPYDRLQTRPVDSRQDQDIFLENRPIYVRPDESYSIVADDISQTRPRDNLQTKLKSSSLEVRPIRRQDANNGERYSWSDERTSGERTQYRPQQGKPKDRVIFESAGVSSRYSNDDRTSNSGSSSVTFNSYQVTTAVPTTSKAPIIADNSNRGEEPDYYFGGLPTIFIPNNAPRRTEHQCGQVQLDKPALFSQRKTSTIEGQWPWQIALYQQQSTVNFKYICGGTLISRRHVITAAHCVTRKGSRKVVNKNTLTVYLGKYNLRTSVDGVQVKFVNDIIIHPEYNASTFNRDVAILELRESVTYSDWVQPVCLWPENEVALNNIIGKKGSVVGWGFDDTGVAREELTLLEMPVVDQDTCVRSYIDFYRRFTSDYTYCAGYRDSTSACNGDSGGGMVFKKGNSWYLRGLVSLSVARQGEYRCDPDHYVIFTDLAKLLPWIEEHSDGY